MKATSWFCKFILAILLLMPFSGSAQKKHVVKLGVNKLFNEQVFVAHEFNVYKNFSIHYDIGVLFKAFYMEVYDLNFEVGEILTDRTKSSSNIRRRTQVDRGYQFDLEGRFRPAKKLDEGLFIGLRSGYQYIDFGAQQVQLYDGVFDTPKYVKELRPTQQTWTIGGTLGFNIKLTPGLLAEFSIYSGYWYAELIEPEILDFVPFSEPDQQRFRDNHRVPVDRFQISLDIMLGF